MYRNKSTFRSFASGHHDEDAVVPPSRVDMIRHKINQDYDRMSSKNGGAESVANDYRHGVGRSIYESDSAGSEDERDRRRRKHKRSKKRKKEKRKKRYYDSSSTDSSSSASDSSSPRRRKKHKKKRRDRRRRSPSSSDSDDYRRKREKPQGFPRRLVPLANASKHKTELQQAIYDIIRHPPAYNRDIGSRGDIPRTPEEATEEEKTAYENYKLVTQMTHEVSVGIMGELLEDEIIPDLLVEMLSKERSGRDVSELYGREAQLFTVYFALVDELMPELAREVVGIVLDEHAIRYFAQRRDGAATPMEMLYFDVVTPLLQDILRDIIRGAVDELVDEYFRRQWFDPLMGDLIDSIVEDLASEMLGSVGLVPLRDELVNDFVSLFLNSLVTDARDEFLNQGVMETKEFASFSALLMGSELNNALSDTLVGLGRTYEDAELYGQEFVLNQLAMEMMSMVLSDGALSSHIVEQGDEAKKLESSVAAGPLQPQASPELKRVAPGSMQVTPLHGPSGYHSPDGSPARSSVTPSPPLERRQKEGNKAREKQAKKLPGKSPKKK